MIDLILYEINLSSLGAVGAGVGVGGPVPVFEKCAA